MSALIEFKNIVKSYTMGDITINASDGVNFIVNRGEFVVIVGASGAGKTTILNLLGGWIHQPVVLFLLMAKILLYMMKRN